MAIPGKSTKQTSSLSHTFTPELESPPKRRKISQACQQCRTRKSRCDGAKPVCGECASRPGQATQCRYTSNQNKNQDYDEYVASLLVRISELETLRDQRPASELPTTSPVEGLVQGTQSILDEVSSLHRPRPSQEEPQLSSGNPSPVDAMGADNSVDRTEREPEARFYGGSSATSLMRQVYQAIGDTMNSSRAPSPLQGSDRLSVSHKFDQSWNATPVECFMLLPRHLTDTILNVYWDKIHHLYPFVHRSTFMVGYARLWSPQHSHETNEATQVAILGSKDYGHDSYIFHCALNGMLALAAHFLDASFSDRDKLAQLFATKSRSLCKLDLFDDGSLASIQTLLLMTMHLQSTPYPNRCWNCIGITCRLAQGLGLHIESPRLLAKTSMFEIEMRRRIWHGCVMLDTIVSTTLGRPMMLHKFTPSPIPMPSPVNDDYFAEPQMQPQTHTSWLCFYIEAIKLYEILADVIALVYGKANLQPVSSEKELVIEDVSRVENAITDLENKLPEHLRPTTRTALSRELPESPIFKQQAFVLQARYLHLRILLYRPTFLRFWHRYFAEETALNSAPPEHSLSDVSRIVAQSISSACVQRSIELIEIIRNSSADCTTGAWWYNLLYLRTAGIITVLALSCDAVIDSVGRDKLQSARINCITLLGNLKERGPSAAQCLKQMETMYRYLVTVKGKRANPSRLQSTGILPEACDQSRHMDGVRTSNETFDAGLEHQNALSDFDFTIIDEMFLLNPENLADGSLELGIDW